MASGVAPVINSVEFLLRKTFERLKLKEKLAIKQQDKVIYRQQVCDMKPIYIYLYRIYNTILNVYVHIKKTCKLWVWSYASSFCPTEI